jgi:hypothetical protein
VSRGSAGVFALACSWCGRARLARRSSRGVSFGCAHPAVRGRVFPSMDSRGRGPWCGQARLPRHVSAPVHAHDGIVGHGQVGLNQLVDRNASRVGDAARRARSLVVSEPHAAVSSIGARQRISPSRKP